jgi:hypothetical protein
MRQLHQDLFSATGLKKNLSSRDNPYHNQIGFIYLEIEEWSILLQNP